MKRIWLFLVLLPLPGIAQDAPEGPAELQQSVEKFRTQLRDVYAPYSNQRIPIRFQYALGLKALEQKAKAAEDAKATASIQRELKRFTSYMNFVPDKYNTLPGPVQPHFDRHKRMDDQLVNEYKARRARLESLFAQQLGELQKTLTVANRIDDAVAVKEFLPTIPKIKPQSRTRPGLAAGATPRTYTLAAEVRAWLERTRWELLWDGGKTIPDRAESIEFHYGNVMRWQDASGKTHKYSYSIDDDLQVKINSKNKTMTFDPSWTLMDFRDEYYRIRRRGRLVGKLPPPASANMLQDIILYYPLDDVAPIVTDAGPHANHATPVNTATVHFGKRKYAWQLDGHSSNLTVHDPIDINEMSEFTVACWFRIRARERRAKIFLWGETAPDSGTYVSLEEKDRLRFKVGTGNRDTRFDYIEKPLELNTWHHVALCYSRRGAVRLYLNGTLLKSMPAPKLAANDTTLIIGGVKGKERYYSTFFNGWIDDFFMFKRELNPKEIKTLYEFGEK